MKIIPFRYINLLISESERTVELRYWDDQVIDEEKIQGEMFEAYQRYYDLLREGYRIVKPVTPDSFSEHQAFKEPGN